MTLRESPTSFQSYTLVVSRQKLNPWSLYGLSWCLSIRRTDSLEIPVSRALFPIETDEFSWTRFLTSWRFLVMFSAASRTVTGVAELLEPFDGPPDIRRLLGRSPVWPSSWNRLMASCHYEASWTVTGVAELLEPFDGPPDIRTLSRDVAVAHSLLM